MQITMGRMVLATAGILFVAIPAFAQRPTAMPGPGGQATSGGPSGSWHSYSSMSANTLEVDQNDANCSDVTGDPYCTIQAALDDAMPGDTVRVQDGVYTENVVIATENVRLRSASMPVIDGAGGIAVTIIANGVEVEGFEIQNGSIGIFARNVEDIEIEENDIHDNVDGILFENVDNSEVEDNDVNDNECDGVFSDSDSDGNEFEENEISRNGNDGLSVDGDGNEVEENVTNENGDEGTDIDGDDNEVEDNESNGNFCDGYEIDGDRNDVEENVANDNGGGGNADGFEICGSDCTFEDNEAEGNEVRGFELRGDRNTFEGDVARGNGGNGWEVSGNCNIIGNPLKGTVSENNGENGYAVQGGVDNTFQNNRADDNTLFGMTDDTVGAGTAGTANTYVDNECDGNGSGDSDPAGLCD